MKRTFFIIALALCFTYSAEAAGSSMSFTVQPVHYLIVNDDMQIIWVITNTGNVGEPVVYVNSANGRVVPYSKQIQKQYFALQPLINYSLRGAVFGPLPPVDQKTWWDNFVAGIWQILPS